MPLDPFFTAAQKVNLRPQPPWVKFKKKKRKKTRRRGPDLEDHRRIFGHKGGKGSYRRF